MCQLQEGGSDSMALVNDAPYLLITPLKDEVQYIESCIRSVVQQTVPPSLWVIVDDGSTDGSADVVRKWMDSHPWIDLISLEPGEWDLGIHYSEVCIRGFDRAMAHAKINHTSWEFIGLVDADIQLDATYFEHLLWEMRSDENLGIASGCLKEPGAKETDELRIHEDKPMGAARLWRRDCFVDAPYIPSFAPDSVSNVKALLSGWKTQLFPDIIGKQLRPMGESHGKCQGARLWGRSSHFLGSKPLFAFLKGLKLMLKFPFYPGLCYWGGYFNSYLGKRSRIKDEDILRFYGGKKIMDIGNDRHTHI